MKSKGYEDSGKTLNPNSVFFAIGIDMSWRLALSVLVPIIGGVELDKTFKTAPLLLIIGFILAVTCSIMTIRRTLKLTSELPFVKDHVKDHKAGGSDG